VEQVSDDPPQRIEAWLVTVNDGALRELDRHLLLDLLHLESEPEPWSHVAQVVVSEIQARTARGDTDAAQPLAFALAREAGPEGRAPLTAAAGAAIEALADGPLAHNVATALRAADDAQVDAFGRLCRTVGVRVIGPLTEALLTEDNSRAVRRLREILIGFGAAGRETIERLKRSPKASVRRTAVEMLRLFGGPDALTDLGAMLDDADSQVQRDAIRAIVQIGTDAAFALLQKALMAGTASGNTITQQLIGLREARAVPLLCYVLDHSKPRGPLADVHVQIMEALGALGPHDGSVKTLKAVLYRGEWWAPARTAALRRAAALALRRIASPEALAVVDEAAQRGSRRIRAAAAQTQGASGPRKPGSQP
jgi:HEAT repeat protein